jgi:hypothetical protein
MKIASLVVVTSLVLMACGKKEAASDVVPVASSAPGAPAVTAEPGTTAAVTVPIAPAQGVTAPANHGSIDACCSALAAIEKSGRDAATKAKAKQAALVCPGIATRVKSGAVPRAQALAQVVSALTGVSLPAECH